MVVFALDSITFYSYTFVITKDFHGIAEVRFEKKFICFAGGDYHGVRLCPCPPPGAGF
jgi:hypothetical protein